MITTIKIHKEVQKRKHPDHKADNQRRLDASSESVPQRPGDDQVPADRQIGGYFNKPVLWRGLKR